ncbi:MAG TPA: hypothetical protein DCZ49_06150 [Hyphomonadaceae bacterium]|nr:hypothetical protein [Hyphomonadaceae bacterium]
MTEIILASTSQIRRKILIDCAVPHRAIAPGVDEAPIKAVMLGQGAPHAAIAAALAQAKAAAISRLFPEAIVIGADQVLSFEGELFDKAPTIALAAENLNRLRGRTHQLLGAVSIQIGAVEHRAIASVATLTCRDFSDDFLADYLHAEGAALTQSVGGYRLEGLGAQLFAAIEGDYFGILGLPLLPVLAALRELGGLPA